MGGRLTDIHGNLYLYGAGVEHPNKRGVLATAKAADHQWFVETIPDAVKELLQWLLYPFYANQSKYVAQIYFPSFYTIILKHSLPFVGKIYLRLYV